MKDAVIWVVEQRLKDKWDICLEARQNVTAGWAEHEARRLRDLYPTNEYKVAPYQRVGGKEE